MNLASLHGNVRHCWRYRLTFLDFARRMLWTYAYKLPRALLPVSLEIGFRFRAPIGDVRLVVRNNHGADSFILGEVFEHEYYSLPLTAPPATVLDLGANVGFSAIYFSRSFPSAELACVEPVPSNLECLRTNLERNGVHSQIFDAAADVADGQAWIELAREDYGHKIASAFSGGNLERIQVMAISLPTLMRKLSWERVGLLKMDIEGHEAKLLTENNEWLHFVDAICVECHEEMSESVLFHVAKQFDFLPPRNLRGIWFLTRVGPLASSGVAESQGPFGRVGL